MPNADVQAGLSRARLDEVRVDTSRVADRLAALSVPAVPPLSMAERVKRAHDAANTHTLEAHDVIAAELVACTLGARSRLELRMDPSGRLLAAARAMVERLQRAFRVTV